jgi:UDP-N-acetylmuramate-alanine ligase
LQPQIIAVTNLYRDQLDAYGEIDRTEKLIRDGIAQCPKARVVVNGDDPRTASLTQGLGNPPTTFPCQKSIPNFYPTRAALNPRDVEERRASGYRHSHQRRPDHRFCHPGQIAGKTGAYSSGQTASPGFFHVYNALTAITIASLLGIDGDTAVAGLTDL